MTQIEGVITSPVFGNIRHGFFTRLGGVSTGIYSGLNCGRGSNDDPEHVEQNRNRVADHMGVPPQALLTLHQVHSPDVIVITDPDIRNIKADGMVTATPNIALGALAADCEPILFRDSEAKIIGTCHAGWKGAATGVIENTVDAMIKLGASRNAIKAAIGPCISQANYEVGPEFKENVISAFPEAANLFVQGTNDHHYFDLPGFGLSRLRAAGVRQAHWTGYCTYADPTRFYSYRRSCHKNEPDYGRLIAAISL